MESSVEDVIYVPRNHTKRKFLAGMVHSIQDPRERSCSTIGRRIRHSSRRNILSKGVRSSSTISRRIRDSSRRNILSRGVRSSSTISRRIRDSSRRNILSRGVRSSSTISRRIRDSSRRNIFCESFLMCKGFCILFVRAACNFKR